MSVVLTNAEAWPALEVGASAATSAKALDIVEKMIREVEAEPRVHSVGLGAWPNMIGELELDASIMDGRSLETGAVGALRGYLHPISVARAVMERLPHVFLVGAGASRFAGEIDAEAAELLTDTARKGYEEWIERHVEPELRDVWPVDRIAAYARRALDPEKAGGTTCVLSVDASDSIAAGVSTSGWAWKYPGRIGDSPIIGAGCYADNRYGAVGCIGTGEMAIRASTARSVILYMKQGLTVREACLEAGNDLGDLSGGVLRRVAIHAIDAKGDHFVVNVGASSPTPYYWWTEGRFEKLESDFMSL